MIDEKILDEIFPITSREELKETYVEELKKEGFVITNFSSGGIFNMLLQIILQAKVELLILLRNLLSHFYVRHATGKWLDLLGEDFTKKRKEAKNTCGKITLYRDPDAEAVEMLAEENSIIVPVAAEKAGSKYNLPEGQVDKCMIHLEGINKICNEQDWITEEGSNEESQEAFRERILNAWAELSSRPIALKYKNICEGVKGVLHVRVDDLHPRGQGTIDIIVTSTMGAATEKLLEEVRKAADSIKGEYDNILVKSADTTYQNVDLTITLPGLAADEGIAERAEAIVIDYFKIDQDRNLNEFILFDLSYALKKGIEIIKNVKYTVPQEDVIVDKDQVIILGQVKITIEREGQHV